MARLLSYDDIISATHHRVPWYKTASMTTVAGGFFSPIQQNGNPGVITYNPGNTVNGIVPVDNVAGVPDIPNFTGTSIGYVTKAALANTIACNVFVFDRLFSIGSISMTTSTVTTTLSGQPSFASRVPNGDYRATELWLETGGTALSNHGHSVSVNYQDQDDNPGVTPNQSTKNLIVGRMLRMPMAVGDSGVRRINSITANGVASASGVFNIHVMRLLFSARLFANSSVVLGPDLTLLPEIYDNSSLYVVFQTDSTASGLPWLELTISHKPD